MVLGLIGGAVLIGVATQPTADELAQREAVLASERFLAKLPDVLGMEMDDAIHELTSVALDVETW